MGWSEYLSIAAILVSTLALFISWRQYSRDRGLISLALRFELETGRGTSFMLSIVNTGRRPVTIRECQASIKGGSPEPILTERFTLEESQFKDWGFPLEMFRSRIKHPLDIEAFHVVDASGRRHSVRTRSIKHSISRQWTPETDWLSKSGTTHP